MLEWLAQALWQAQDAQAPYLNIHLDPDGRSRATDYIHHGRAIHTIPTPSFALSTLLDALRPLADPPFQQAHPKIVHHSALQRLAGIPTTGLIHPSMLLFALS